MQYNECKFGQHFDETSYFVQKNKTYNFLGKTREDNLNDQVKCKGE